MHCSVISTTARQSRRGYDTFGRRPTKTVIASVERFGEMASRLPRDGAITDVYFIICLLSLKTTIALSSTVSIEQMASTVESHLQPTSGDRLPESTLGRSTNSNFQSLHADCTRTLNCLSLNQTRDAEVSRRTGISTVDSTI